MMKLARKRGMSKSEAQAWVYSELDRMNPPASEEDIAPAPGAGTTNRTMPPDGGPIQGLGDIPADWPELPDNASLAVEVGWVQANRLRIVEERAAGATVVWLDLSGSPNLTTSGPHTASFRRHRPLHPASWFAGTIR